MRQCTDCSESKPETEFARQREPEKRGEERTDDGLNTYCRSCSKKRQQRRQYEANREGYIAKAAQWKRDNPEKWKQIARDYARKKRWAVLGITEDEYHRLLEQADNRCEVCSTEFTVGVENPACVDHCHGSGVIRGVLCTNCNLALGYMQDDPARLRAAAAYLERVVT